MRNPLQDQLLKAGLVKKGKVDQVAREQSKQRQGKAPTGPSAQQVEAQRLLAERAERDRALAAERNAQARASELRTQARQLIDAHKVEHSGDITYRFADGQRIASVLVDVRLRAQLASGALVIVRHGEGYELIPRAIAGRIDERDPGLIVLDHGRGEAAPASDDDAYYQQFPVPDDLIW
ncbi:DUF2058 domain-containing protein [Frateuria terrea]|uniref:Nucleoprotein/polynucleotide-associated enzyme n=1 Tax=Frateuria terrea TaxID=529704 RepID=A0A1H6XV88_9GAMM|nr:DUF2058 domain-containing protein [Frateuria terrea]SEJ32998.1 hypothetical protein SAMN04487997_3021 [Frateuria terrea]SFP51099.1 hypothetical protein SAMN02927913_2420 [Frateuria terrea]